MTFAPPGPLDDFLSWVAEVMRVALHLPAQASTTAAAIDGLQALEFVAFWLIGLVVLGAGGWWAVRYRRTAPPQPTPRVEAPLWLEVALVGGLLGMFLLFWVIGFRQYISLAEPPADAIDVYVTGRQWLWQFGYADGPANAGMLVVPVNRPVRLLLTSRDVIHSFYVPAFRIKQDAVPGRFTTAWFTARRAGRYDVFCAELCGTEHSRMRAEVVVLAADDYSRWLHGGGDGTGTLGAPALLRDTGSGEPPPPERLATTGLRVAAEVGCLRCHTTDGTPHIGPSWFGLWQSRRSMWDGAQVVADAAYITESMMDPQARIVAGYPPLMPSYQGRITPAETAAIIELIRSLQFHPLGTAPPGAGFPVQQQTTGAVPTPPGSGGPRS